MMQQMLVLWSGGWRVPSRTELDKWLENEPYIMGKVWDNITIINAKLGDSFKDLLLVDGA